MTASNVIRLKMKQNRKIFRNILISLSMQHLYRSSLERSWTSSSRGKGLTLNFFAGARGISSHNIGLKVNSNLCSDFIVYKKLSWVCATLKHLNLKLNGWL